jgi:hypothetical protein
MTYNYNIKSRRFISRDFSYKSKEITVNFHIKEYTKFGFATWYPTTCCKNIMEMLQKVYTESIDSFETNGNKYKINWKCCEIKKCDIITSTENTLDDNGDVVTNGPRLLKKNLWLICKDKEYSVIYNPKRGGDDYTLVKNNGEPAINVKRTFELIELRTGPSGQTMSVCFPKGMGSETAKFLAPDMCGMFD